MRNLRAQPATPTYAASVPISVYREISADLQVTQAMNESLKTENHKLIQQNQQLRQELDRLVQSAVHTQQAISHLSLDPSDCQSEWSGGGAEMSGDVAAEFSTAKAHLKAHLKASANPGAKPKAPKRIAPVRPYPSGIPDAYYEEHRFEQEAPRMVRTQTGRPVELNRWSMGLIMGLIVFSAFGAGFLIVRPLLPSK
jgi:hypothetical protein